MLLTSIAGLNFPNAFAHVGVLIQRGVSCPGKTSTGATCRTQLLAYMILYALFDLQPHSPFVTMFICLVRMRGLSFAVWFAWSGQLDTDNTMIRGGEFAHSHVPSRNLLNAGVRCKMSLAVHASCLRSGGRCSTMNSSEWQSQIDIMLSLRQEGGCVHWPTAQAPPVIQSMPAQGTKRREGTKPFVDFPSHSRA